MDKFISWIKSNKLTAALILIVVYLLSKQTIFSPFLTEGASYVDSYGYDMSYEEKLYLPPVGGAAPVLDVANRMVATNSYLSVVVKDVDEVIAKLKMEVEAVGGYVVSSNVERPEGLTTGYVNLRVPAEQADKILENIRGLVVKVVSETTSGDDITDQYMDLEERLATLENVLAKYEGLLASTSDSDAILQITDRIIDIQGRIEYIKGQMQYSEQISKTTLITVNLSTDEFELPYAPEKPWRPEVVFKLAVRELVTLLQTIGSVIIYAIVFSPLVVLGLWVWKRLKKSKKSKK